MSIISYEIFCWLFVLYTERERERETLITAIHQWNEVTVKEKEMKRNNKLLKSVRQCVFVYNTFCQLLIVFFFFFSFHHCTHAEGSIPSFHLLVDPYRSSQDSFYLFGEFLCDPNFHDTREQTSFVPVKEDDCERKRREYCGGLCMYV